MEIVRLNIQDLKPYKMNAKVHTAEQIEQIKKSIKEFGMNDPVAIWGEENTIVEGHGRVQALKEMGVKEVDCIRLDHLTDEERKAYTLVHNKLTMNTDFDDSILDIELKDIVDINMQDFGFLDVDYEIPKDDDDDGYYGDERERTNDGYNLDLFDETECVGYYQMPIIHNDNFIPDDLIELNSLDCNNNTKKWGLKPEQTGIHFYEDDYKFERIWNRPIEYIEVLSNYQCVLSPDFSLYMDMPRAMKVWNVYRSRLLGQYFQRHGIKVIPTIQWAEKETFDFCFDGIPEGSVVSISTIGVKRDKEALQIWHDGVDAMIEKIKPSVILCYGGEIEHDYKGIKVIYYNNKATDRMKENRDGNS